MRIAIQWKNVYPENSLPFCMPMWSAMTFGRAVEIYGRYLESTGDEDKDALSSLLGFLEWNEPQEKDFAQDIRLISVK